MATTLKASGLKAILDKAKNRGLVEEPVEIAGLNFTLRSLVAMDYSEILSSMSELEGGPEYMYLFQVEHLCRSIVEIEGSDLREAEFITIEVTDDTGKVKEVNVLRHEWLKDNVVKTWDRDMVQVSFHKFLDVCAKASEKARQGVEFYTQSETEEEKFRRLLAEALAASEQLPDDLTEAILKEAGLLLATSQEELEAANEQARKYLIERQQANESVQEDEAPEDGPAVQPQTPRGAPEAAPLHSRVPLAIQEAAQRSLVERLATRTPLNQEAVEPLVPDAEGSTKMINVRPPAPDPSTVHMPPVSRSDRMAALEALAGETGVPFDPQILRDGYHSLPGSEHAGILEDTLPVVPDAKSGQPSKLPPVDGGPLVRRNKHFVDPRGSGNVIGGINPRDRTNRR